MMAQIPVRDIDLQNSEFLGYLNDYKDIILEREPGDDTPLIAKSNHMLPRSNVDDSERYVSDEYLKKIMDMGRAHDGFPEQLIGFAGMKHDQDVNFSRDPVRSKIIKDAASELNTKLMSFLSCRNVALTACYPPGGCISWHNNANAKGYNILITYSETGDGWFDYWDWEKKERVRIQDIPGWQAKMTYFGPYDDEYGQPADPEQICYHAAYTDCYRITCSFVFAEADEFWEEVINDLETKC